MGHRGDTVLIDETQKKRSLVTGHRYTVKTLFLARQRGQIGETQIIENTQEDKKDPVVIEMV